MDATQERSGEPPVAVVTGGGSGFGAAMASELAADGFAVAVLDIDGDAARTTVAALEAAGATAVAGQVDVADRTSMEAAATEVGDRLGGCNVLCANVAVQQFGAIDTLRDEDWQWMLSVNVMGLVRTVGAFLPLLRSTDGERHIAITSSSTVLVPAVRLGAYITTKFAATGYAEVLRLELADEGIGVTTVFPAGMATNHLGSSMAARPAALGVSELDPADLDALLASPDALGAMEVTSAEHAARNLVRELRAGSPYVITHGDYRGAAEVRFDRILEAFDRT